MEPVGGGSKRFYSEALFCYCRAMSAVDKEAEADDWDEAECERQRKLLKRELKAAEKALVPPSRAPAGEGTKGNIIKSLKLNSLEYDEENPLGEFENTAVAHAGLIATCGKWLTPQSGMRGGGNGAIQSYHAKDEEPTAACAR